MFGLFSGRNCNYKWADALAHHYQDKWGCKRYELRTIILEHILACEGAAPEMSVQQVEQAFTQIKRRKRIDHYGVSVAFLAMLFSACPYLFVAALGCAMASAPQMAGLVIAGSVFGKEACATTANKTRTILPLPAVLQVVDALLPILLRDFLATQLPATPETFVGAQPKTQCLDIAHSLHLVIEKGIDMHGAGAIAQSDIQQFFDSIPLLKICLWMVSRGCSWMLAACVLRHQLLPKITLRVGAAHFEVHQRTIGGLTGSRVAGCMARIPVESIFVDRSLMWRQWGFALDGPGLTRDSPHCRVFCMASWVDNLFAVSDQLLHAIWLLEDFALQLKLKWGLEIKPSSRSCMVSAGSASSSPDPARWPQVQTFDVLGHKLDDTGGIRACWIATRKAMWRSFWGNAACNQARQLPLGVRLGLVKRATVPILDFRCSRWPPQHLVAKEIGTMQRKMAATLLHVRPAALEEPRAFASRKGRLSSALCRRMGWWSVRWWRRCCDWDAHIRRERNAHSWCHALVTWHDGQWLAQRRAEASGNSSSTSRTRTRAVRGHPQQRWDSGIALAAPG